MILWDHPYWVIPLNKGEKMNNLVLMDLGTSKTDAHSVLGEIDFTVESVVGYKEGEKPLLGSEALDLQGAIDIVWFKEYSRISREVQSKYPYAFRDFAEGVIQRIGLENQYIDLMLSEPTVMTKAAREEILNQLRTINQIKRVYFLKETRATVFKEEIKGNYILMDIGDGNTSTEGFNGIMPIRGSERQTFRAGRMMTLKTGGVIRDFFDIDYSVESSTDPNYQYLKMLKEKILQINFQSSLFQKEKGINLSVIRSGKLDWITITPLIQNEIVSCLFDTKLESDPINEIIRETAFQEKIISAELLQRIFCTGNPLNSLAILTCIRNNLNELFSLEKEGFGIENIQIERVGSFQHSVISGMKKIGVAVQNSSKKWIEI